MRHSPSVLEQDAEPLRARADLWPLWFIESTLHLPSYSRVKVSWSENAGERVESWGLICCEMGFTLDRTYRLSMELITLLAGCWFSSPLRKMWLGRQHNEDWALIYHRKQLAFISESKAKIHIPSFPNYCRHALEQGTRVPTSKTAISSWQLLAQKD